ncbi:nucleotidyltransferase [Companilactobacillus zhachilii]|uniref:tRNA(Met) cytidine acetate ligase n=1 Tax=Companilactobacillus zhachilii TaxID=2304606 RepID=A0A386PTZ9_9LACO|nr:nucleotidyltransferase [Companilactobacillus zhachilii]AYE38568.1 nucleotidyltransferase [Companilactobacillus zhachilii]
MKVYGLIAEFNPFHNGHKLFVDSIKQKYHPDVLIAVMSGNFVQRGDFAILDKWDRAKLAVELGVDLVIELPVAYAVEPAELFAKGAIKLLETANIDTLVFGTEQQVDFDTIVKKISQVDGTFNQDYQQSSALNLTNYYQSMGIDVSKLPNQLLGLNYVQQIQKQALKINVQTIQRLPSDFSATKVRHRLANNQSVTDLVPELTQKLLVSRPTVTWNNYFPFFKYRITSSSVEELHQIYQMVEGLEYKLKKEIVTSDNFEQFLEQVKSKRYTMARLRRLMIYVLLNVKADEINNVYKNTYLRILGFNKTGQKYLNALKKSDVNLITRVGKKENNILDLEIRADRIRQLVTNQEENFGRMPYMKGVN